MNPFEPADVPLIVALLAIGVGLACGVTPVTQVLKTVLAMTPVSTVPPG